MAFPGLDYSKVEAYRIVGHKYAPPGLGYGHAEAGTFGAMEPGSLVLTPKIITDKWSRERTYGYQVVATLPSLQAGIPVIKNLLLMKGTMGFYFLTAEGKYFAFDQLLSRNMGVGFVFEITDDKRELTVTATSYITKAEWTAIMGAAGSAPTDPTGGSTLGLTANSYDLTDVSEPYIDTITIGGVNVGPLQQPVFRMTQKARNDQYGRPVGKQAVTAELTARFMESDILTLTECNAIVDTDFTTIATTLNGDSVKFTSGAGSGTFAPHIEDLDRYIDAKIMGDMIYNTSEATPDSIDAGVGSATVLEFKLRGAV